MKTLAFEDGHPCEEPEEVTDFITDEVERLLDIMRGEDEV